MTYEVNNEYVQELGGFLKFIVDNFEDELKNCNPFDALNRRIWLDLNGELTDNPCVIFTDIINEIKENNFLEDGYIDFFTEILDESGIIRNYKGVAELYNDVMDKFFVQQK
jgi:hypothetical protein